MSRQVIRRRRRRSGTENVVIMVGGALVAGLLFALPTSLLMYFGMLPTIVALLVDTGPGKYAMRSVAGFNFSGLIPFLMTLWTGQNNVHQALAILTDVYAWLVIYGAAAVGWMLFFGLPPVVATITEWLDDQRVLSLRSRQRHLVRDWGEAVAGDLPVVK